jgi:hypothetical protein
MPHDFINRSSERMHRELLGHTIAFLKHIDSQLAPDNMAYTVTEQDVADFFGAGVGFIRVALALNQLTKMRFEAENSLEWIICSLLNTCAFRKERKDLYISFTREGRMILRILDVDTIMKNLR